MVWVCEFSPAQGCFHVDTLEKVLEVNRQAVARGDMPGFVPLALFRSSEEAHAFSERWQLEHPRKGVE